MGKRTEYAPGCFCWVDLAAADHGAAKTFYTELFGWSVDDRPTPQGAYSMFQKDGLDVCACYGMGAEMKSAGIPSHWASYVSVASADDAAAKAAEAGGKVAMEPFDVMRVGRMAMLQDPAGATFAVWQPEEHHGASFVNHPGGWSWNELRTTDPEAAAKFYGELFGWTAETSPGAAGGEYVTFKNGERLAGGMIKIQESWGPTHPHWGVYFSVADIDASLDKANSLGGKALMPVTSAEGVGRFAMLHDSQGAELAIIQLENPEE